jgi:hypothetical protein
MTSADPMVPDPLNGQARNRYSYVVNNPLAFTDPSGRAADLLRARRAWSTKLRPV